MNLHWPRVLLLFLPRALLSPHDGVLMNVGGPSVGLPHIVPEISHWAGAEEGVTSDIRPDEEESNHVFYQLLSHPPPPGFFTLVTWGLMYKNQREFQKNKKKTPIE